MCLELICFTENDYGNLKANNSICNMFAVCNQYQSSLKKIIINNHTHRTNTYTLILLIHNIIIDGILL